MTRTTWSCGTGELTYDTTTLVGDKLLRQARNLVRGDGDPYGLVPRAPGESLIQRWLLRISGHLACR
jgi:hypothetical protein